VRKARLLELEAQPKPDDGYGPSWQGLVAGRREFAGRALSGPYIGHDLLIHVYGESDLNRSYEPKDFDFAAEYIVTDHALAGPGDDDPDPWFPTLEELREWLANKPIDWYPPYVSLARLGLLHRFDGRWVP
jgi:hypothetical protein